MSSKFNCLETITSCSRNLIGGSRLQPLVDPVIANCEEKRSMNYEIANTTIPNHRRNEKMLFCQDVDSEIYFEGKDMKCARFENRLGTDGWTPSLDRFGAPVMSLFARFAVSSAATLRCLAFLFAFLLLSFTNAEAQFDTVRGVDLEINKTIVDEKGQQITNPTFSSGETVTYRIVLNNDAATSKADATGIVIFDDPENSSGGKLSAPTSSDIRFDSRTNEWTINSLTRGGVEVLDYTVVVGNDASGTLCNLAYIKSADQLDVDSEVGSPSRQEDDNSTACFTVDTARSTVDLALTKVIMNGVTMVEPGDLITYSLHLVNTGDADATSVVVEDVLPSGVDFDSVILATTNHWSYDAGTSAWTIGTVPSGGEARIRLLVAVKASSGTVTNCTQVLSTGQQSTAQADTNSTPGNMDPNNPDEDDESCVSFLVNDTPSPDKTDLEIDKTVITSGGTALGDTVTYSITVTNSNRDGAVLAATNLVIEDQLPSGVKFVSASDGAYSEQNSQWSITKLEAGSSATLQIRAEIDGMGEGKTVCNTSTIKSADQLDKSTLDDKADACFTIESMGGGSMGAMSCPAGSTFQDNLFSGLNQVLAPSGGSVTDAYGQNWTIAITGDINGLPQTNNACDTDPPEFEGGLFETCYHWNNNTDGVNFTFTPAGGNIDSLVVLVMDVDASIDGDNSSHIDHVVFPAATSVVPVNANPSFTFTANSLTGILGESSSDSPTDRGAGEVFFPSGLSSFSYSYSSIPPATPNLQHILTQIGACVEDPVSNDIVDLELTKVIDQNSGTGNGDQVTYLVTLTNNATNANATASSIEVTDYFPLITQMSVPTANPSVGTYNSISNVWHDFTLAPGASATLELVSTILAPSGEQICNSAEVTVQGETDFDSTPNNGVNQNEDDDDIVCFTVTGNADCPSPSTGKSCVHKTVDVTSLPQGDTFTFTLTVENDTMAGITSFQLTDTLPNGLAYDGTQTVNSPCTNSTFNQSGQILTWTFDLPVGDICEITFEATGDTAGNHCNESRLRYFPTTGWFHDSDQCVDVTAVADCPSPSTGKSCVHKTVDVTSLPQGDTFTFTLTVENDTMAGITSFQLTDTLPNGLTYDGTQTVNAPCTNSTFNQSGQILTWTFDLPVGDICEITFEATGDTVGNHCNDSRLRYFPTTGWYHDSDQCVDVTANADCPSPSTGKSCVHKTVDVTSLPQGDTFTFKLTVENDTMAGITSFQLTDTLPNGLTYDGTQTVNAPCTNSTFNQSGQILTWTFDLPVGDICEITFEATGNAVGNHCNESRLRYFPVTVWFHDSDQCVDVTANADCPSPSTGKSCVHKTVDVTSLPQGDTFTFTLTVENDTMAGITSFQLTDTLPNGLTYDGTQTVNAPCTNSTFNQSGQILTWTFDLPLVISVR